MSNDGFVRVLSLSSIDHELKRSQFEFATIVVCFCVFKRDEEQGDEEERRIKSMKTIVIVYYDRINRTIRSHRTIFHTQAQCTKLSLANTDSLSFSLLSLFSHEYTNRSPI